MCTFHSPGLVMDELASSQSSIIYSLLGRRISVLRFLRGKGTVLSLQKLGTVFSCSSFLTGQLSLVGCAAGPRIPFIRFSGETLSCFDGSVGSDDFC